VVRMTPLEVEGRGAVGITVDLPGTRLVIAATDSGYLMCGALDVALLDARLAERRVVAGRALGVRSLEELLAAPLESVTAEARRLGLREGMSGREALRLLAAAPAVAAAGPSA
jgi:uncharacterized protein YunC (DUF1805 family)